jgi:hypothetical protein
MAVEDCTRTRHTTLQRRARRRDQRMTPRSLQPNTTTSWNRGVGSDRARMILPAHGVPGVSEPVTWNRNPDQHQRLCLGMIAGRLALSILLSSPPLGRISAENDSTSRLLSIWIYLFRNRIEWWWHIFKAELFTLRRRGSADRVVLCC